MWLRILLYVAVATFERVTMCAIDALKLCQHYAFCLASRRVLVVESSASCDVVLYIMYIIHFQKSDV